MSLACFVRLACSLSLLVVLLLTGACKEKPEHVAIRQSWESLDVAMDNRNGKEAVGYLSSATLAHYDTLIKAGLDMPPTEVWALPPCDMYEVLRMRNRATKAQLKGYTGKGFFIFYVSQGWHEDADDGTEWKLKDFKVTGSKATANLTEVLDNGGISLASGRRRGFRLVRVEPRRIPLDFTLEDGAWKIEVSTLDKRFNDDCVRAAKESRMAVREFLMDFESMQSGKDVTMKTWDKPK